MSQDLSRPVVRNEEKNGYHDSDFYAVFFNQNSKNFYGLFSREEIGSTRYGGGTSKLPVTENIAVIQLYKYWQGVVARREKISVQRQFKSHLRFLTEETKLTGKGLREIFEAYGGKIPVHRTSWRMEELRCGSGTVSRAYQMARGINELMRVKNFRSDFRKSLAQQVLVWIETPVEERQYKTPLTQKQVNCLKWGPIYL